MLSDTAMTTICWRALACGVPSREPRTCRSVASVPGDELVGETITIQWVFDGDELRPATALNVERYGDDAVWYDAVVKKVTPKTVEVFYPDDNETKRHNLLVSGITDRSPKPNGNYMAKGLRWKIKK